MQVLVKKREGWEPEDDDEDFEIKSEYFWTGVGDGSPDYVPLEDIKPGRHGVDRILIENVRCLWTSCLLRPIWNQLLT